MRPRDIDGTGDGFDGLRWGDFIAFTHWCDVWQKRQDAGLPW